MKTKFTVLSLFLSSLGLFACGEQESAVNINANRIRKGTPVPVATVDELASGKKVYETNCAICHKEDGTGGKMSIEGKSLNVEDLTADKIKNMTDERIITYIMNGVEDEGMPAFKSKLSEGEMRDVVKFIRTQFHRINTDAK